MTSSGSFDSPFHDSEVEALEEAIRLHPAKGFRLNRYTHACPSCGRGVTASMLEAPHYNPTGRPVCSSCRARNAKWYRTLDQVKASREARDARKARGEKPKGFVYE